MMIETDKLELEMETGTSYWDCLKGTNLRRTEISIAVFATQVFSGIYMVGYAAYFFNRKFPEAVEVSKTKTTQLLASEMNKPLT